MFSRRDLRADRQPEFTQLDLEMSFPRQEDIFGVSKKVMVNACTVAGIKATAPFPHMLYKDASASTAATSPTCRFGMELPRSHFVFSEEAKTKLQIEVTLRAPHPGATIRASSR